MKPNQRDTNRRLCRSIDCSHLSGLFLINGLGMGNSTRCYSVIQRLASSGLKIHVLTSGNGLRFFQNKPEIASLTPMESFFYAIKDKRLSIWRTVCSLKELGRRACRKRAQVEAAVTAFHPDFCVTDSEYVVGPFRKRGIPVIALNNADTVVAEYLGMRRKPRDLMGQFWLVEYLDYLFHRQLIDLVISPAAKRVPPLHARIRRVGLIVRKEIEELARGMQSLPRRAREFRHLTFMLSGSILGQLGNWIEEIGGRNLPYQISVVGMDGPAGQRVKYYGKMIDNINLLARADLLLINAGFSAVSEALALNKPTLVIPVARHAEQYVNARQIVELGHGDLVAHQDVAGYLDCAYATNARIGRGPAPSPVDYDGAGQAAEILLGFLQSRGIIAGANEAAPGGRKALLRA